MQSRNVLAATHSGSFHADDVVAYAILKMALGPRLDFFRSRDPDRLKLASIVFDVGGVYDPAAGRYDHHMRDKPLRGAGDPYSSAGLIWQSMGRRALRMLFATVDDGRIEKLWTKFDRGFIHDIDLIDNGLKFPNPQDFSVLVSQFNPPWDEDNVDMDARFYEAAEFATGIMSRVLKKMNAAFNAEQTVLDAHAAGKDPRVLELPRGMPYQSVVFDHNLPVLFVVYASGTQWRVDAMPPEKGSFAQRLPLPKEWGGLDPEALKAVSGIPDANFCHPNLFTAGADSHEGIKAMVAASLKNAS